MPSPFKIYTGDKKENQTLKHLQSAQDAGDLLTRGAYMSARADGPDYSWMNVVGAGVDTFKTELNAQKIAKDTKRKEDLSQISGIVDGIYDVGGSLPQEYFDQAYDYTGKLREEYLAAIESGDKKAQALIKGKLNGFSTMISTLKTDLTESAGMWKDESLINSDGMTDEQISISKSIDGKNSVLEEGTYKWKNVDYDPTNPKSKEFFTTEDLKGALPLRDDVTKETYLKNNKKILENGENFRNGTGNGFDQKTNHDANMKLITEENIQSMIWDDQTGQGSFAESLDKRPDFINIFETINTADGLPVHPSKIAFIDENGDGHVDFRDFFNMEDPEVIEYFDDYGGIQFSDGINPEEEKYMKTPDFLEDVMKMMDTNPKIKSDIELIAKDKLKNAITKIDSKGFNIDVSKKLVSDFLTNRQRQMFYGDKMTVIGGKNIPTYELMVPGVPNSLVKIKRGKLMYGNPPTAINTIEELTEAGGSYGYMKDKHGYHYTWDSKTSKGTWTQIDKDEFNTGTKKYNKQS